MWPKPRQPTATAYHPIRDTEQQHDTHNPAQPPSLWPTAPIPPEKLLSANSALKPEQLLGGNQKINQSLLLSGGGGNKPIAEHLLLQPRFVDRAGERERKGLEEDEGDDREDDDFEHLDYLEATDDMPLTSTLTSRKRFKQGLRRVSLRSAFIGATVVVVVVCLVVGVGVLVTGGKEHELGPGDYRR